MQSRAKPVIFSNVIPLFLFPPALFNCFVRKSYLIFTFHALHSPPFISIKIQTPQNFRRSLPKVTQTPHQNLHSISTYQPKNMNAQQPTQAAPAQAVAPPPAQAAVPPPPAGAPTAAPVKDDRDHVDKGTNDGEKKTLPSRLSLNTMSEP